MGVVKFIFGKPQRNSIPGKINNAINNNIELDLYNIKSKQYSCVVSTRYPENIGKLCKNIFDE